MYLMLVIQETLRGARKPKGIKRIAKIWEQENHRA
jgi:hypothetical protein